MIKDRPLDERPRERCLRLGAHTLSLRECLAVILGTGPPGKGCLGLAEGILAGIADHGGASEHGFFTALELGDWTQARNLAGLGDAGLARLMAAFEIARRYAHFKASRRHLPTSRAGVAQQALRRVGTDLRCSSKEWLGFVAVDARAGVSELYLVEFGGRTYVHCDLGELFARILPLRGNGFYLFHNHPSGHCEPSREDIELTDSIYLLGKQLGCPLLGHWIVGAEAEHLLRC